VVEKKEITKKQIQINWDYSKQQNDIRCRLYLQCFAISLTVAASFIIASIVENAIFVIFAFISFIFTFIFIMKLRSVTYDLEDDWQLVIGDLERLK